MGQVGTPVGGNGIPHPYALLADGRWREAAQRWRESGCRYEAALARTSSTDPHDLLEALAELDELGAEPLARSVRATLRLMGVAKVPRGPLPSTRDNPSGLTQRQSEVAQLVVQGMTNAEIAAHLVVSIRTVDSHVAAILGKLGTRSRRELVTRAAELGVLG
jgi:DNA-binding NarL/FixJ family response regulator